MSSEEKASSDKQYYQTFSGSFRTKVPEGHPEAMPRINKKNVQVFEKEVKALFGVIEDVAFEQSDYGKQLKITLDKNEDGKNPVLTFGVESKDGRDVLKKLPGIDFSQEVRIMPYRFKPEDKDEEISGISIFQKDGDTFTKKVDNFFFDPVKKEYINGYPTLDWDKATESEQKIYKIQRDEFLVKYAEEKVIPKFSQEEAASHDRVEGIVYPDDEINPEDIPF